MVKNDYKDILIFFDTDENASPFDILMAYDAGFDEVIPYENLKIGSVQKLVRDSIYPRGPEGIKHTSFLIGGSNPDVVQSIVKKIEETMFPPFVASVVVDPRGANTTASALVAKVEQSLEREFGEEVEDENVVVLAGTGPVGRVVARLFGKEGADVTITSRSEGRAKRVSDEITEGCDFEVEGIMASSDEEIRNRLSGSDIVVSAGPEGVRVVSKKVLREVNDDLKVVVDLNASHPTGVEDLEPDLDGEQFVDGVLGIGGLAVGKFKSWLEREILSEAKSSEGGIFGEEKALEMAKLKLDEQ